LITGFIFCEDAKKSVDEIALKIENELRILGASIPTAEELRASIDPVEVAKMEQLARNPTGDSEERQRLRDMIVDINRKALGDDVIQKSLNNSFVPGGGLDPNAQMTYAAGSHGLLWIFWAMDVPGIEPLPGQILEAQEALPELYIRDSHVMPLSKWQAFIKKLSDLKDELERVTPGESHELALERKKALRDSAMPLLHAGTVMARTRRKGGYLIMENQQPGIAYHVADIPSFVYLSPLGIVHRVKGVNKDRSILQWIKQTQLWEQENIEVLRKRGLIK
jgi:hypothetical protein